MNASENYFKLFGLPVSHQIDRAALEAAYEKLTLENHPDFFAAADEADKLRAEHLSAHLNEGYRALTHEPLRAAYLLGLLADGLEGDLALNSTALPEGFLQEMFALQEELDDLEDSPDPARGAELAAQIGERARKVAEERAALFSDLNGSSRSKGSADPERLGAIQSNLNCEKYLNRLLDRLA